jgi:hypothetical protein
MLRDQIDYQEFCRRGKARQESGSVRAGMVFQALIFFEGNFRA